MRLEIQLVRGVRQEDPLSPALFILAMDALHATLQWAVNHGLLSDLGLNCGIPRVSIYADDAVIFVRPVSSDLAVISEILGLFADSSGLRINLQKSSVTPISCSDDSSQTVVNYFQCLRTEFPIAYLGLPLSIRCLRKTDLWPLIEKFYGKLKGWKPKLLTTGGRLILLARCSWRSLSMFSLSSNFPNWCLLL